MGKTREGRVEVGNLGQSLLAEVCGTEQSQVVTLNQIKETIVRLGENGATNTKILVRIRLE